MQRISFATRVPRRSVMLAAALAFAALGGRPSPTAAQVSSFTAADAGPFIGSRPGVRVVLLYSKTCRYSHAMFPEVVALTERYGPLGVNFLAFSIDKTPDGLEEYLGSVGYPFERMHIQPWEPGQLGAALLPAGVDGRTDVGTPHIAVLDAYGQLVGVHQGVGGARSAERWLRALGFRPLAE